MAARNRARTQDKFIDLINQAQDESFDLRSTIENDGGFMGDTANIVEPLNHGVTRLLEAVNAGEYEPGQSDYLDFLELKNTDQRAVPFRPVLQLIVDTHDEGHQGLDDE